MQVSNAIIAVVIEVNVVLLLAAIIFYLHSRKLKSLIRRQQQKLLELLNQEQPAPTPPTESAEAPKTYQDYVNSQLDTTNNQFRELAPLADISTAQAVDQSLMQRVLALRYAFLQAEESATHSEPGTPEYWSTFEQLLAPLLAGPSTEGNPDLAEELETAKKRIENLEKFKRLFFDMENQWNSAKANADDYYSQLMELSAGVSDRAGFDDVLQRYHNVYDDIHNYIKDTNHNQAVDRIVNSDKTIHITRQDPRAAEEIIKLRNVAADQHRIINQLHRKLEEANTAEEKELVINELQQQLQRQTRFVQESETCILLLEEELAKVHSELSQTERALGESAAMGQEFERMKTTLKTFTLESKDLVESMDALENENRALKESGQVSTSTSAQNSGDLKKIQSDYNQLQKQYAELEEKYLELKLG